MDIKSVNMKEIFGKIDDLKSVFKIGERILPILQSLIDFMGEIIPLLENINTSISDSTNQMPKVSHQINNVTSATELATTEILDPPVLYTGRQYRIGGWIWQSGEDRRKGADWQTVLKDPG